MNHLSADPYEALGVPSDADADAFREAWHAAAKECHPDAGGDPDEFRNVQWAWEVLKDSRSRAAWDAGLRPSSEPVPAPAAEHPVEDRPIWARNLSDAKYRYRLASVALGTWVRYRVLLANGLREIVSPDVLDSSEVQLRRTMAFLATEQVDQLLDEAHHTWLQQNRKVRSEIAGVTKGHGVLARTLIRHPAGSLTSRLIALVVMVTSTAVVVATNVLVDHGYFPGPISYDLPPEAKQLLMGLSPMLALVAVLVWWVPTWAISWVRFGWGERSHRWARAFIATAMWAFSPLLFAAPWLLLLVLTVAWAAGRLLGAARDARDDRRFRALGPTSRTATATTARKRRHS